ncbi:MAG: choice-of-anchor W domain-containing protein [Planctomycetota bacterium]
MKHQTLFAAVAFAAGAAMPASAAVFTQTQDVEITPQQEAETVFVAEGRIGDLGGSATFEFDLGASTAAPADTANFAWTPNQAVALTLDYDFATGLVTFDTPGGLLTFDAPAGLEVNQLYVRVRAIRDDTVAEVEALSIDAQTVGATATAVGPDDLEVLIIAADALSDGFSLDATGLLDFDPGAAPSQSQLAFQIKAAVTENPIPEPGALAALAAGALGIGRRRRP